MYACTELYGRGGFLGWLGITGYRVIWFLMMVIATTIWLLTLGGKLIKENEKK